LAYSDHVPLRVGQAVHRADVQRLAENRVRFLAPVPAGSQIRVWSELIDAAKVNDTTVDLTVRQTVELQGSDKPAAVAEIIARMVF
jgi:acyl dehydratase